MTYTKWLFEQTAERVAQSLRLMEISTDLGEANRNNDKQAKTQLEQELREIYQEIDETG